MLLLSRSMTVLAVYEADVEAVGKEAASHETVDLLAYLQKGDGA